MEKLYKGSIFCHHGDTICHPGSGYLTTKLHGTSTCGSRAIFTLVVSLGKIRDPKSVRLKDRDYDVTPNIIAHMYPQISNGSVKECEVEMVGEECEVYCEDGRRRVARG